MKVPRAESFFPLASFKTITLGLRDFKVCNVTAQHNQIYFRKDSSIGDQLQQYFSVSNSYILQQAIFCEACLHTKKTNIP